MTVLKITKVPEKPKKPKGERRPSGVITSEKVAVGMMDRLRREVGERPWSGQQYAFKDPVNAAPTPHNHMLMTATI